MKTEKIEQPSEAEESANAAHVWRKKVQVDLVDRMRQADVTLESAEFWFERFRRAFQREIETKKIVDAEKGRR